MVNPVSFAELSCQVKAMVVGVGLVIAKLVGAEGGNGEAGVIAFISVPKNNVGPLPEVMVVFGMVGAVVRW